MALKLYVWQNMLSDYYPGIAFAMAENAADARRQIIRSGLSATEAKLELAGKPSVYRSPKGFHEYGGG